MKPAIKSAILAVTFVTAGAILADATQLRITSGCLLVLGLAAAILTALLAIESEVNK